MGNQECINLPQLRDEGGWEWLSLTTEKDMSMRHLTVKGKRKVESMEEVW